jgi:hypothetical protein
MIGKIKRKKRDPIVSIKIGESEKKKDFKKEKIKMRDFYSN